MMLYFSAKPGDRVHLGRRGENLARTIQFDISEWIDIYGHGTVNLIACHGGDASPHPCAIHVNDNIVDWPITNANTAVCSNLGHYELLYTVGEILVKSAVGTTKVDAALGEPSDTPPEACRDWVDEVLTAASEVKDATLHNPVIIGTNWHVWDFEKGEYVDTGCRASGNVSDEEIQMAVNVYLKDHPPAYGPGFTTDDTLVLDPNTGVLSVNTADAPEADNTRPITSAAVHSTVGNIEILLKTI